MVNLCVFNSTKHGCNTAGFLSAKAAGEISPVNVDNGDCSYSIMYSVHNAAKAAAKCMNSAEAMEMGVYREDEYVSINELDGLATDFGYAWDSLEAGFTTALEARAQKENKPQEEAQETQTA